MHRDEIRALYVETLARSRYERTRIAMNYPMNMPPWDDAPGEPYEQGGITVLQAGTFDPRRRDRVQAGIDVDALDAAGLLPTGTQTRVHPCECQPCPECETTALADGAVRQRQYVTEWREVIE